MAKSKGQKLGKFTIALFEGIIEKHVGENFVKELREGYQEHESLIEALANTEKRFREEFEDKEFTKVVFNDLSLDDLPSLKTAYKAFYTRPTSSDLPRALRDLLVSDFGDEESERINRAIAKYLALLRDELSLVDVDFRKKADVVSTFNSE